MNEFALIGAPTVGKTTLFNALTGKQARTGNYAGVTVGIRSANIKGTHAQLYDLPGIYSLSSYSLEEKTAADFIRLRTDCLFVHVAAAANLSRALSFTRELAARGRTVLVLSMYDEFTRRGGKLDLSALSRTLGIPVFAVNGNRKKDILALKEFLFACEKNPGRLKDSFDLASCYAAPSLRLSGLDKILFHPVGCFLAFLAAVLVTFWLTFGRFSPGTYCSSLIADGTDALADALSSAMCGAPAWLRSLFTNGVIRGAGGVLCFLPQLAILEFFLILLEESGFLARAAFLTDGLFRKVGLNGRAVFSMLLGFGCTAMAVLSTRSADNEALQKKTALSLCLLPCGARMPVLLVLVNAFLPGGRWLFLAALYFGSLIASFFAAWVLNRFFPGEENFLLEMPPLRAVNGKRLLKALLFYVKNFIIRIGSAVLAVALVLWALSSFDAGLRYCADPALSLLAYLGEGLKYLFYPMGITDWRFAVGAVTGLFAKESVLSTLLVLCPEGIAAALTADQALCYAVFCALYTPCFAALAALRREIGLKYALWTAFGQTAFAFAAAYLVRTCLLLSERGLWWLAALSVPALILALAFRRKRCGGCEGCRGDKNEGVCRRIPPKTK